LCFIYKDISRGQTLYGKKNMANMESIQSMEKKLTKNKINR
jgi:hypothetical protein